MQYGVVLVKGEVLQGGGYYLRGLNSIIGAGADTLFAGRGGLLSSPSNDLLMNGQTASLGQMNLSLDYRDKLMGAAGSKWRCGNQTVGKGGGGLIISANYFKLGPSAIIDLRGGTPSGWCNDCLEAGVGGGGGSVIICAPNRLIQGQILVTGGPGLQICSLYQGKGGDGWILFANN
jgi:hypothetical protein